ncbi:MAG: hypothetical protein VB108_07745 [Anaerolineaceae bacterium]|nr:hypothetical protein [Anaerolineaceae bacterium]
MKRKLNILSVCGSGVVSSSMVAQKVKDALKEINLEAEITCILPSSVEGYVERQPIDLVVTTSPIPGKINVPVIKGISLLTGFGEDDTIVEIQRVAKEIVNSATA